MAPPLESTSAPKCCWTDASIGAGVGLVAWFALGFHRLLSPSYLAWIFHFTDDNWYYDPGTTFMGWHFFRHAPWTWPLGMNPAYGLEFASSIIYSDSLPLFAF